MSSIPQRPTYLYAMRAGRTCFVKVGISTDPTARLGSAQTDCPHELYFIACVECARAYDAEQWVHAYLRHRHVRREWFWVFRNAHVKSILQKSLQLHHDGTLPIALRQWQIKAKILRSPERTIEVLDRVKDERTRRSMINAMVYSGWSVAQIRAVIKGENAALGAEIDAARQRLGIEPDPPRAIPLRPRHADERALVLD